MALAVTEEQAALAESVAGWAERAKVRAAARAEVDVPAANRPAGRPEWWAGAVELGLTGLALPEEVAGSGATAVELAVAIEELGHDIAHGPLLPSAIAGLVLLAARQAGAQEAVDGLLRELAEGHSTAAVALDADVTAAEEAGGVRLSGNAGLVLGLPGANWLLVSATGPEGESWAAIQVGAGVGVEPVDSLDVTRSLARVTLTDAPVEPGHILAGVDSGLVRELYVTLAAAEAAGIARWAQETATAYAKVREQFGRPIGSFQAIKHMCADMLARSELAASAAWDAASAATSFLEAGKRAADERQQLAVAAAIAGGVSLGAAVANAKDCVQILGGIGFTWEHDAHLGLRRAAAMRALAGGTPGWHAKATALGRQGLRRRRSVALGAEAEPLRQQVRDLIASLPEADPARRAALADAGLITPHWPKPYGLAASPIEQLTIAQELAAAGVRPPDLVIGNWAVPTIIEHGNDEQRERFARPTLLGDITWCQLFSEPGAGSDLASLRTRATKTDGGWTLSGQKVWTSLARDADWGICLARSNPDAPNHKGITYFLVDMKSKGIDVRPLREITGHAMFNEVFLDDVFVPDDCVVGAVDGGWRLARTTLANERVAMSATTSIGGGLDELLETSTPEPVLDERIGGLLTGLQAAAALGQQITLRQLGGLDPGASSSVRKLVGMYQIQDARELALEALGSLGADVTDPANEAVARTFLSTRALTIAGGSSQVLRNVIAERLLGLPRD